MNYTDLSNSKMFGNFPADIKFEKLVSENDSFFMEKESAEPVLNNLAIDILPSVTDTWSIGSSMARFLSLYSRSLYADFINLYDTVITKESGGLSFALSSGSQLLTALLVGLSSTTVQAANATQFRIRNSADASEWSIGAEGNILAIKDIASSVNFNTLELKNNEITARANLKIGGSTTIEGATILLDTQSDSVVANSISVLGKTRILIDTSTQNVLINNITNGVDGQTIFIVKTGQLNSLTITHSEANGVLLKGCQNFVLPTNSFGGITLTNMGGTWFEVSRS